MSSSSAFPCSCSGLTRSAPCYSLVEHGYSVRACVRDATRTDKTAHLLALNGNGVGSVEVVSADMTVPVSGCRQRSLSAFARDSDEKLLRRERMTSRSRAAARCYTWPPTSPPTPPTER